MRRVVVTGVGMVSPLACGVKPSWRRLLDGQSGVRPISKFDVSDLPSRIAGQVPRFFVRGRCIRQDLEGHRAVQARVVGTVDLTHPTLATELDDPVVEDRFSGLERAHLAEEIGTDLLANRDYLVHRQASRCPRSHARRQARGE